MATRNHGLLAPCYKCNKREVGCHSGCSEYKEYSAEVRKRTREAYANSEGFIDWKRRKRR